MRKTLLMLLSLVIALSSIDAQAQKRKRSSNKRNATTAIQPKKTVNTTGSKQLMTAKDGYQWYLVKKDNLYGAQAKSGKTIIPAEYDSIRCVSDDHCSDGSIDVDGEANHNASERYFKAMKNGYVALFYPDGRCPISVDRKYTDCWILIKANKAHIGVFRNHKSKWGMGICDMNGVEVISPLYAYVSIRCASQFGGSEVNYYYIIIEEKIGVNEYYYNIADLDGNIIKRDCEIISYKNGGYYACKIGKDDSKISINQNSRYNFNHISGVTSFYGSISPAPIDNNSGRSEGGEVTTDKPRPSSPQSSQQPSKQLVQVWKPCQYCGGTGICSYCGGWGIKRYTNSILNCGGCGGNGKCSMCGGMKGHYWNEWR